MSETDSYLLQVTEKRLITWKPRWSLECLHLESHLQIFCSAQKNVLNNYCLLGTQRQRATTGQARSSVTRSAAQSEFLRELNSGNWQGARRQGTRGADGRGRGRGRTSPMTGSSVNSDSGKEEQSARQPEAALLGHKAGGQGRAVNASGAETGPRPRSTLRTRSGGWVLSCEEDQDERADPSL